MIYHTNYETSLAVLVGLAVGLVAAPTYSASLQALPDSFRAVALSGDGSTVVGDDVVLGQAIRWRQADGPIPLGKLPGGYDSHVRSVSTDGSVVVGYASDNLSRVQAFRWTETGGLAGLGFLPGDVQSQATGVSADGSKIVGYSRNLTGGDIVQAFYWTQADGMASLGGPTLKMPRGISADGTVVAGDLPDGEGYRWSQSGGLAGFDGSFTFKFNVSETISSIAIMDAVSADGSTFVGSSNYHPAFWKLGAGATILDLPSGRGGAATSASADGSVVVGKLYGSIYSDPEEAFIWDSANGTRSLMNVLSSQGVDMTYTYLKDALGVSDDGQTVLLAGYDSTTGDIRFWLAHLDAAPVPLPASVWLFGSGLAGLLGIARRKA